MRKTIATLVALMIAATVAVSPAATQAGIVVNVSEAEYSFGQHITFHLEVTGQDDITQINLFFRIQGQTDTTAVSVPFEPGSKVSADYPYSLVGQDVPPFATIIYWWEIHDAAGERRQSEERLLYYADNRYEWQSRSDQHKGISLEVYWVQGDVGFGQRALNVAIKALDELYRELETAVPGVIRIYIYPSEQDLRSALNLAGYAWAGGQARPELGAVLVGIPDSLAGPGEMERLIPHELTHLLVFEAAGRTVGRVPPWLNEGLASINEHRPDPNRQAELEQALAEGGLFSLEALCAPFPADEELTRLAYAQSASVVQYLHEEYGSQLIRDLLATYAENVSCEAGVTRVLGKSLNGLESAWLASLKRQGQVIVALNDSAVWLSLWLLTALLVLPLVGVFRRANR